MKPLNHIRVKADRRLRGSQAWLEIPLKSFGGGEVEGDGVWGVALEPSHFRFASLSTLTTLLSLNSLLTLWELRVNSLIVAGSSLKDNLSSAFCLTPPELRPPPTFWIGAVCLCLCMSVCTFVKVEILLFCIMGCLQACDVFLILTRDWSWLDSFFYPPWESGGCRSEINGPIHSITAMTIAVMVWKWAPVMWSPLYTSGLGSQLRLRFISFQLWFFFFFEKRKRQCSEGFKESHMTAMGVECREVEDPSVWPNGWDAIPPALPKDKQPLSCNFPAQIMTPLVRSPSSLFSFDFFLFLLSLIPGNVLTSCVVVAAWLALAHFPLR